MIRNAFVVSLYHNDVYMYREGGWRDEWSEIDMGQNDLWYRSHYNSQVYNIK